MWLTSACADCIAYTANFRNCCTCSKTAVVNTEAFRHLIMSQQGKRKTKSLLDLTKNRKFSCILYAHSQFLCSLARFDLANWGVLQPVRPHAFYAWLLVFDEILPQPDFAVVSDVVMSVFYSPVLTRSLKFFELLCRSVKFIFLRYPNLERW